MNLREDILKNSEILNEEMSEKMFKNAVRGKKTYLIFGKGVAVDAHGDTEANKKITAVLQGLFPKAKVNLVQSGRFGLDDRTGWKFENQMGGSGHPASWESSTRGYYAMTNRSLFLFPKDDQGIMKHVPDFSMNVLGGNKMTPVNRR